MATYHDLVKASCVNCDWSTQDPAGIEVLNDIEAICPVCEGKRISYTTVDGLTIEGKAR